MSFVSRCRLIFATIFFFQAEDGIRDLVRSRGLGDVYKRQIECRQADPAGADCIDAELVAEPVDLRRRQAGIGTVSYTHLTLPTSDLV